MLGCTQTMPHILIGSIRQFSKVFLLLNDCESSIYPCRLTCHHLLETWKDGKENMQGAEVVKDEIYRVSHAKQQTVHKRGEEESVSRVETSVRSDFCDLR